MAHGLPVKQLSQNTPLNTTKASGKSRQKGNMLMSNETLSSSSRSESQYPVESLLKKAKEFSDEYLDEMALKFYEKAYEQEPLNQVVLDSYSEFLVNWSKQQSSSFTTNHIERCKFLLQASNRLDSSNMSIEEEEDKEEGKEVLNEGKKILNNDASMEKLNPSKYLYLAQLQIGGDALRTYEQGIKKLKLLHDYTAKKLKQAYYESKVNINDNDGIQIENTKTTSNQIDDQSNPDEDLMEYDDDENTLKIMKYQICNAYCSMCDIYMTDLCYEDNAEEMCITYMTEASTYDVGAVEYLSTLASLRLSQTNNEEAVMYLLEAYKRIKYIYKELQTNDTLSQPDAAFLEMITPSLESKVCLAKMLLEAAQLMPGKACARKAGNILYICRMENDTDPEIMYLMGVALFTMNPPDYETSLEFLHLAQTTLEKELHEQTEEIQSFKKNEGSRRKKDKALSKSKTSMSSSSLEGELEEDALHLEGEEDEILGALKSQLHLVNEQITLVQQAMQSSQVQGVKDTEKEDELSDDDFDFGLCVTSYYDEDEEGEDNDDNNDDGKMQEEGNI